MISPVPSVPTNGDLRKFALDVAAYLRELERERTTQPVARVLASWSPEASASQSGVIMFHRQLGVPVISVNGVWYRLALGASI
jgi:hypothetical protein